MGTQAHCRELTCPGMQQSWDAKPSLVLPPQSPHSPLLCSAVTWLEPPTNAPRQVPDPIPRPPSRYQSGSPGPGYEEETWMGDQWSLDPNVLAHFVDEEPGIWVCGLVSWRIWLF